MIQDALKLKERIISFIRLRGPSLPVHISKETGLSILFASAFLSDLYSEKLIGISNLKVGSSPLYFIPGQEPQLENFSKYLKSKEKEAFLLLKEKKFLKDSELQPAVRVALREIKDFAIPFKKNEEIYWRFFVISEEDFETDKDEKIKEEMKIIEIKQEQIIPIEEKNEIQDEKKIENIFDDNLEQREKVQEIFDLPNEKEKPNEIQIKKEKSKHVKKKNQNKKRDENFFNKIKEYLEKREIEILDIKDFKNNEAILKVKKDKKEELLFVFNSKKITEKEILKSYKKASEENLKYSIIFLAEAPKKLNELIEAVKNISEISKLE